MMTNLYPFSAIVGQEKLKLALMICAVNPTVGGVLIVGDKGTAKSTAARGVSELLQPIETTIGCAFKANQSLMSICQLVPPKTACLEALILKKR